MAKSRTNLRRSQESHSPLQDRTKIDDFPSFTSNYAEWRVNMTNEIAHRYCDHDGEVHIMTIDFAAINFETANDFSRVTMRHRIGFGS